MNGRIQLTDEQRQGLELLRIALASERQLAASENQALGKFIVNAIANESMNPLLGELLADAMNKPANKHYVAALYMMLDITFLTRHWKDSHAEFDAIYARYRDVRNNNAISEEQKQPLEEFMRNLGAYHHMAKLLPILDPLVKLNIVSSNNELSALHEKMRMCSEIDAFLDQRARPPMLAAQRTSWSPVLFVKAIKTMATDVVQSLKNEPKSHR